MKKFAAILLLLTLSNVSVQAIDQKSKGVFLSNKLIYAPQKTAFKKAILCEIPTAILSTIPLSILRLKTYLFFLTLFGSSYLWLRYWRSKENKMAFIDFVQHWPEYKEQTPEIWHEKFSQLYMILLNLNKNISMNMSS